MGGMVYGVCHPTAYGGRGQSRHPLSEEFGDVLSNELRGSVVTGVNFSLSPSPCFSLSKISTNSITPGLAGSHRSLFELLWPLVFRSRCTKGSR